MVFTIAYERLFESTKNGSLPKRVGSSGSLFNFQVFGKIIGHSLLNGCSSYLGGLQDWVCDFIINESTDLAISNLNVERNSIPENAGTENLLMFIDALDECSTIEALNRILDKPENLERINSCQWLPTDTISLSNKLLLISELINEEVVRKRIPQITAVKKGLEEMKLLQYFYNNKLLAKKFLKSSICQDFREILLKTIHRYRHSKLSKEEMNVLTWFEEFIQIEDIETIKKIIGFTTGRTVYQPWEKVPSLAIKFLEDSEDKCFIEATACLAILELPTVHTTKSKFFEYIKKSLEFEGIGFAADF